VHRENAARIFNKRLEEITPEERYLAKRVIHASNYGMGHKRLVQVVNEDAQTTGVRITDTDAKRLIDAYFMLYPKIREVFWKDVENELRRSRTLTTPFGRKRTFFGRWDEKLLREAYSYIPQSIVGDLCCKGLVRAHNEVRGGQILLNVHDAILGQCLEESIESVARATAKCLAIPVEIKGRTLTIPTDIEVGKNWAHEDADNPDGLKKWKVA
jgi:DNA polymerase-1